MEEAEVTQDYATIGSPVFTLRSLAGTPLSHCSPVDCSVLVFLASVCTILGYNALVFNSKIGTAESVANHMLRTSVQV